jgi:hypothetical protein
MAPQHRTAVLLWIFPFLASVLLLATLIPHAQAQRTPEHAITYFQNQPVRLFFFDDSSVRSCIRSWHVCAKLVFAMVVSLIGRTSCAIFETTLTREYICRDNITI